MHEGEGDGEGGGGRGRGGGAIVLMGVIKQVVGTVSVRVIVFNIYCKLFPFTSGIFGRYF